MSERKESEDLIDFSSDNELIHTVEYYHNFYLYEKDDKRKKEVNKVTTNELREKNVVDDLFMVLEEIGKNDNKKIERHSTHSTESITKLSKRKKYLEFLTTDNCLKKKSEDFIELFSETKTESNDLYLIRKLDVSVSEANIICLMERLEYYGNYLKEINMTNFKVKSVDGFYVWETSDLVWAQIRPLLDIGKMENLKEKSPLKSFDSDEENEILIGNKINNNNNSTRIRASSNPISSNTTTKFLDEMFDESIAIEIRTNSFLYEEIERRLGIIVTRRLFHLQLPRVPLQTVVENLLREVFDQFKLNLIAYSSKMIEKRLLEQKLEMKDFLLKTKFSFEFLPESTRIGDLICVQKCLVKGDSFELNLTYQPSMEKMRRELILKLDRKRMEKIGEMHQLLHLKQIHRIDIGEVRRQWTLICNDYQSLYLELSQTFEMSNTKSKEVFKLFNKFIHQSYYFISLLNNVHLSSHEDCVRQLRVLMCYVEKSVQSIDKGFILKLKSELNRLIESLSILIKTYFRSFNYNYSIRLNNKYLNETNGNLKKENRYENENLVIHLKSISQLDVMDEMKMISSFYIRCSCWHGNTCLFERQSSPLSYDAHNQESDRLMLDEQFKLDGSGHLPKETVILVQLIKNSSTNDVICWCTFNLYVWEEYRLKLILEEQLISMYRQLEDDLFNPPCLTSQNNLYDVNVVPIIQLKVSLVDNRVNTPIYYPSLQLRQMDYDKKWSQLSNGEQTALSNSLKHVQIELENEEVNSDILSVVRLDELWKKRHYLLDLNVENIVEICYVYHRIFPYTPKHLRHLYSELNSINIDQIENPLKISLKLLLPIFIDDGIRALGVKILFHHFLLIQSPERNSRIDELMEIVPQLVQLIRYDPFFPSALTDCLLLFAITNRRFAVTLYWNVKVEMMSDRELDIPHRSTYYQLSIHRYYRFFDMLLAILSDNTLLELRESEKFCQHINRCATAAIDFNRQTCQINLIDILQREIGSMKCQERIISNDHDLINFKPIVLPVDVGWQINSIIKSNCKRIPSKTNPIQLTFRNTAALIDISLIYKIGDDLRQDMLAIQLIDLMNVIWMRNRLNLRVLTYRCLQTGSNRGFVQVVDDAETLRSIQQRLSGMPTKYFQKNAIHQWLLKGIKPKNTQRIIHNFMLSCAAYCVATYILGVGDRHNDNIMVRKTGHMFHIDFGKYFGEKEKFMGINRDRVNFTFTPDMRYVITNGDANDENYAIFVDICCRAINVIRRNNEFLSLMLQLLKNSGIAKCGGRSAQQFLRERLMLGESEQKIYVNFQQKIEESLNNKFVLWNFMIHGLNQPNEERSKSGQSVTPPLPLPVNVSASKEKEDDHFDENKNILDSIMFIQFIKNRKAYSLQIDLEDKMQYVIRRSFDDMIHLREALTKKFKECANVLKKLTETIVERNIIVVVHEDEIDNESNVEEFVKDLMKLKEKYPPIFKSDILWKFVRARTTDHVPITDSLTANHSVPYRLNEKRNDGKIRVNIRYENEFLSILIISASNLVPPKQNKEQINAYVKVDVVQSNSATRTQCTKNVRSSTCPVFNDLLQFDSIYNPTLIIFTIIHITANKKKIGLGHKCISVANCFKENRNEHDIELKLDCTMTKSREA
ncbi:hypothetical protein SNEBB_007098 [Seison nebaliae]|nr:hypothetical protein SNEBB_007098 [Seison nebaliae]